jgi:hypothetical protein
MSGSQVVFIAGIPSSKCCVIFARCLGSELRLVLVWSRFANPVTDDMSGASGPAGRALRERIKCANQPPASMKANIKRDCVSG